MPLKHSLKNPFYSDYKEMLSEFQPEIVSICTPTATHIEIALAAAKCPSVKTIFLEKPIAQSLGEADEIIRACHSHEKRLAVNYARRWSKVYAKIKQEMRFPMWLVGVHPGPLIRTGTHMIDLFNWFFSPLDPDLFEVQAIGQPHFASYMQETEDFNINGYIKYGESSAALIGDMNDVVSQDTVVFELTAWNKDIEFVVKENGCRTEYFGLSESKRYANLKEYRRGYLSEDEPENMLLNAILDLTATQSKEFIGGSFDGRQITKNACSGLDARRDLQVALTLHYSATHGNKTVKLSEVPYDYTVRSY